MSSSSLTNNTLESLHRAEAGANFGGIIGGDGDDDECSEIQFLTNSLCLRTEEALKAVAESQLEQESLRIEL